ncbi:hypothetical protein [Haloimpatiens massiliensis]|uniref:hypothetical protein n=1 Tax=Haloimpatiens massiliensis TaxID=1658110 RepID=UPI000C818516|nr:hypothetical protein [Haloimpatiens massiliensis]
MIFRNYAGIYFQYPLDGYYYSFIRDVFEARLISYDETVAEWNKGNYSYFNQCLKNLRTQAASNIGFCMESFIEYYLSVDELVRLEMLKKCYHNSIREEYNQQCFPLGLGLNSTFNFRKQSFDTKNPHNDIVFLKKNKKDGRILTNNKSNSDNVGFQIKAIITNVIDTIITPIIKGKYSQVLTLLETQDGDGNIIHTKEKCLLHVNLHKNKFNKFERRKLENFIISPSDIGIPQQLINNYYDYMKHAFNNEYDFSAYIYNGLCLYYNWICFMGQCMNKQKQIDKLPIVERFNETLIEISA